MSAPSTPEDFTWEQLPPQDNNLAVLSHEPTSVDQGLVVPVQPITFLERGSISALPAGMTLAQMPRVASIETDESSRAIQYVYTFRNGVTIGRSVLGTFLSLDSNVSNAVREFDIYKYGKRLEKYYDPKTIGLPWKMTYPARMLAKVSGAFFKASDTVLLPQMQYDTTYKNTMWRTVTDVAEVTDKPRDVLEQVSPLARMLLTLNVQIEIVDDGLKQIETRARVMGVRSGGTASEEDLAARRELTLHRKMLINQALGNKTEIESIASAEKERIKRDVLVASVIPDGMPNTPEVLEITEAIQRVFSDLYSTSRNDSSISLRQLQDAAASMAGSIHELKDPTGIMLMYANFINVWAQNGLRMPTVEDLQQDIAQHRDLR